jgi:hypothetical protein
MIPFPISLSALTFSILGMVSIIALCLSIFIVRRDHPNHICTIWLGFSFTLCFVGAWNLVTYLSAVYTRGPLFGKTIDNIILPWLRSLAEVSAEIAILIFIFWIFVVPQILSYFLSGVFGCASRPIFISKNYNICSMARNKSSRCLC